MSDSRSAYEDASDFFNRNLSAITPPESDPVSWNLSIGLLRLARAIQMDMEEVKRRLDALEGAAKE
jgi:hypothetical protein